MKRITVANFGYSGYGDEAYIKTHMLFIYNTLLAHILVDDSGTYHVTMLYKQHKYVGSYNSLRGCFKAVRNNTVWGEL